MASAPEPEVDRVAQLVEALQTGDRHARYRAIRNLVEIGPEAAVPALVPLLRDADLAIRTRASEALAHIGAAAVPSMVEALLDPDVNYRRALIVTLGKVGPPAAAALPVLTAALEDAELGVAAAQAVRAIRPPRFHLPQLGALLPYYLLGLAGLVVLILVVLAVAWVTPKLFPEAQEATIAAALALGFLGAGLGAALGAARRGPVGSLVGAVVLGLGGSVTGILVAGPVATLLAPLARALGGS
jgi:HEAT repeat protein